LVLHGFPKELFDCYEFVFINFLFSRRETIRWSKMLCERWIQSAHEIVFIREFQSYLEDIASKSSSSDNFGKYFYNNSYQLFRFEQSIDDINRCLVKTITRMMCDDDMFYHLWIFCYWGVTDTQDFDPDSASFQKSSKNPDQYGL